MRLHKIVNASSVLLSPERDMLNWTKAAMSARQYVQGQEVCGYVDALGAALVRNMDLRPGRFAFPMDTTIDIYERAGKPGGVIAIWHSHPDGRDEPSTHDLTSHPQCVPFLVIVNPVAGTATWWEI